jgi:hypothetical protein
VIANAGDAQRTDSNIAAATLFREAAFILETLIKWDRFEDLDLMGRLTHGKRNFGGFQR